MGRQTPAYRGTVGIRGARQPGRQTLRPGATNSTIAKIAQKLSALTRGIDAGLDENSKVLSSTPSLDVLRGLATSWQQFEQNLLFWSRDLARRADQLDEEVARLDQLGKTWGQTLTRAQS